MKPHRQGSTPYRVPARTAKVPTPPPPSFTYVAVEPDRRRRRRTKSALLAILGLVLTALDAPAGLIGPAIAFGAALWLLLRPGNTRGEATLQVRQGHLEVYLGSAVVAFRAPLRQLSDVAPDTKEFKRVIDGDSPIPVVRQATSRVAPDAAESRIELRFEGGRTVPLTEFRVPNVEVTEPLAKVRSFLRAHGWLPEHERDEPGTVPERTS